MKTFCFAILLLGCTSILQAQYYVKEISKGGTIYADGKKLKKGDRIASEATLRFDPITSYAIVLIPGKTYLILGVGEKDRQQTGKGEFIVALKEALFPPNEYNMPGTRGDEVYRLSEFADQWDIKAYFRDNIFLVDSGVFQVAEENFLLDSVHYFTIRHKVADGWFAKRLPHVEQAFEINKDAFTLKGLNFTPEEIQHSELYFEDEEMGESLYLGRFNLQFVSSETILEDLKWLIENSPAAPEEVFLSENALPYFYMKYGKTQPESIKQIMQSLKK